MPQLSPKRKPNPGNGTDVSKSKFKLSINGISRKRKSASADDDAPKPPYSKSKSNPGSHPKRETTNERIQSRKQFSMTKSRDEFNLKNEERRPRTRSNERSRDDVNLKNEERRPRTRSNEKSRDEFNLKNEERRSRTSSNERSRADFDFKSKQNKQLTKSNETKSRGELNLKTERKQVGKRLDGKKSFKEESAEVTLGDKPKRGRKRIGIRLDPYDISNKRMDDSAALIETQEDKKKKKQEDSEKAELSMNAQFRAIKPSSSILTFVQDNLLGRRRSIDLQRAGYNVDLSAPLDNIPNSTSSDRERVEETIFRNRLTFYAAAKSSSSFPPADAPEIAFAGRSNVGKSSLLNALTRQWGTVRTSDKPGLTQTINFFELGPKLSLVDLPGYGFAYAKEEVKDAWEELVKEYVSTRVGLKRVCLLIDTKWGMKPRDQELINLMERSQTKYQVVLTKTDVVFPIDVARRAMQIEDTLKENKSLVQPVMMVSSTSGAGIRSLRTVLAKLARFVKP